MPGGGNVNKRISLSIAAVVLLVALAAGLNAQSAPAPNSFLLTIFLRHDQTKTLTEINAQLKKNGYFENFPPPGVEVVSWYVLMGIGQVVTLRVPVDKLRETNRAIELHAWGGFRTEFYTTYDYKPIWDAEYGPAWREATKNLKK